MTKEELEALLASEEAQAVLKEKYVDKDSFDKVVAKKEQILGEKKKEQERAKALEAKVSKYSAIEEQIGQLGFQPDEALDGFVTSLASGAHIADQPGAQKQKDLEDGKTKLTEDRLIVQQKTYEAKIRSMQEEQANALKERESIIQTLYQGWDSEKVENTLSHELERINVKPGYRKMLRLAFKNKAEVLENEDGVRVVLFTDENGLKSSAAEFFDAFAQSEEGKGYIAAPISSGGGALGGKGSRTAIDFRQSRAKALAEKDTQKAVENVLLEWKSRSQNKPY